MRRWLFSGDGVGGVLVVSGALSTRIGLGLMEGHAARILSFLIPRICISERLAKCRKAPPRLIDRAASVVSCCIGRRVQGRTSLGRNFEVLRTDLGS